MCYPIMTLSLLTFGLVSAKVRLINQGYEGVIIAINPDLKENYLMLQRLEHFLTAASATLFKSTRYQVYFREFIVVIPEDWKPRQIFQNAMDVELDRAQIVIDRSNPGYGDAPYVKQYAECGSPGLYIHLTPGYLLDEDVVQKWGRPEKTLVHEWAHLRWGLFDEYPIDQQDDAFYRYAGLWQPTRCSTEVEGSILNEFTSGPCNFDFFTGKPEKDCRFFPRMGANKAAASIMFMQYLDSIMEFCDDPATAPKHLRHNFLAPNRQNRLCQYKSAWEVMAKHPDFSDRKKPLPVNTDTRPRFRYVQSHPRKRVLVLDTSGSMTGASLNVMKQAASNYILSCIETGSRLGIVQFSTNATALSPLTEVASERDRFALIDSLPTQADGKTSIGSGLKKGVEVLTQFGDAPGGSIILITDGKENEGPYLKDLRPALMKRGIVVHALAYGQMAEQGIAELSQETGGRTFFYSGRQNSTGLIDGLAATVLMENPLTRANVPQSILTDAATVRKDTPVRGSFFIDSTVGKETSLTFSFSEMIEVKIQGPGRVYTADIDKDHFRYDLPSRVLKVILPDLAKTGVWYYHVTTKANQSDITVNIQSKSRGKDQDVLQVQSWLKEQGEMQFSSTQRFAVYTEVSRGRAPVLDVEVVATIERPHSSPLDVYLKDNGVGADIIKDDGVYSASIVSRDLTGDGRYNIKVKVIGRDGQAKVITANTGKSSRALQVESSGQSMRTEVETLENFQRVTSAGEFRLKGFPAGKALLDAMKDEMPPSRVTDLRVTSFNYHNFTAVLEWTAVGGDMERGTAARYVVHLSEDFQQLLTARHSTRRVPQEHVLSGRLDRPQSAGSVEQLVINTNWTSLTDNRTVFICLFAEDEAGNQGDSSNVVSISPAPDTAVPRVPTANRWSMKTLLTVALPLSVATGALVVLGLTLLLYRSRKSKSQTIEQLEPGVLPAGSCSSLNDAHMNYMFEGEYRKRQPEDVDTWSRISI